MVAEAYRQDLIPENPCKKVMKLALNQEEAGIFPLDVIAELFNCENIFNVWNGDLLHCTLNLISASTGLRQGEIRALKIRDIHPRYI